MTDNTWSSSTSPGPKFGKGCTFETCAHPDPQKTNTKRTATKAIKDKFPVQTDTMLSLLRRLEQYSMSNGLN